MKKTLIIVTATMATALAAVTLDSCNQAKATGDYASFVDPFIGTGGHGHTFPGAVVPNGMIQPSPDTRIDGWDACSGYYYGDSLINGFSHTHVNGTGCADYGDVLFMPTVGAHVIDNQVDTLQNLPYASRFIHANEIAEPGYYSVILNRYDIKAELTATDRVALHRYTYPKSRRPGMIIDMDYSIQRQNNLEMALEVLSDTEIRGWKMTEYWAFEQQIFFYAKFSKPFTHTLLTDTILDTKGRPYARCKALLNFAPTKDGDQVLVKVGVSAVDYEGAQKNVEQEMPDFAFDETRRAAREKWNDYLSKIDVPFTSDKDDLVKFYTALYHTAISPNLFTDVDGRYLGMDLKVKQGDAQRPVYTIFSIWDTFRALHPLLTIIDP